MKMKPLLQLTLIFFVLISCKNETAKTEKIDQTEVESKEAKKEFHHEAGEITVAFNEPRIDSLFASYITLKTALINTNSKVSADAASELLTAYSNLGVEEELFTRAMKLVEAKDIETQRSIFSEVTADVETLLSGNISSGALYKQFCPMAFNNTGAFWLSESDEIANPYFGDKMYRCGVVKAKIE